MSSLVAGPEETSASSSIACICLVGGLPGAGKTSFVRALKGRSSAEKQAGPTVFYISFDSVYNSGDHDEFDADKWRASRAHVVDKVNRIVASVRSGNGVVGEVPPGVETFCLAKPSSSHFENGLGPIIMLDDNFYYKSMRHVFYKIAQEARLYFGQVFLKATATTCLQRNRRREGREVVPDSVIERMSENFEWPSPNTCYQLDTEAANVTEGTVAADAMAEALDAVLKAGPVPAKIELSADEMARRESDRRLTIKNEVHFIDNFSKKLIGRLIKTANSADLNSIHPSLKQSALKELVARTQGEKKLLLKEIRQESSIEGEAGSIAAAATPSREEFCDRVRERLEDTYAQWGLHLIAAQLRHDLGRMFVKPENAEEETIATNDTDAVEELVSKIKTLSFQNAQFRCEAASSGLGESMAKVLAFFASVFVHSKSFSTGVAEIVALRILKLTFLGYRNLCANAPSSQRIAATSGALLTALQFVLAMMRKREADFAADAGEDWRDMGLGAIRSALQFVGNGIVMCDANQSLVWEHCIKTDYFSEMVVVGARMERNIYGTVVMIVYNCICHAMETGSTGVEHMTRLNEIVRQDRVKNTVLSSILLHVVTEKEDDPGFVWGEVLFEAILDTGMFGPALESVKPAREGPVKISMEQRVLIAFLSRCCLVDSNESEGSAEPNNAMLQKLTGRDAGALIDMLHGLVSEDGDRSGADECKAEAWRSFLVDAITAVLELFADLTIQGSNAARETIAEDTKLLKFVILCLANPSRLGIAEPATKGTPGPNSPISAVLSLRVLANLFANSMKARDEIREIGAIPVILSLAHLDAKRPLLREWGILAIRNLCANNEKNQTYIENLKVEKR